MPLVEAARAAGFRVEAVLPPGEPIAGLRTHDWALDRRGLDPVAALRSLRALRTVFERERPALVHLFTIKPMAFGGLAARQAGVPAVHTVTGLGYAFIPGGAGRRVLRLAVEALLRRSLRPARAVLFQNADDRDLYVARGLVRPGQAFLVAGSGVDLAAFDLPAPPPGVPVVAFVGRLLADKGVREFVASARLLRRRGVACRCVLVGELDPGNRAGITQAELEGWRSEGAVEVWGWRPMAEALNDIAIVCLPSYREGVPRVLLEGAAARRAVVATDVPGCRDAVEPGTTGLLVPPRDPAALADAIAALALDPPRRQRMGEAGRRLMADRFAMERVNRQVVDTYLAALAQAPA